MASDPTGLPSRFVPLLDIDQVSHGFGHDRNRLAVLDSITLTLERGGFAALVGPSGCGKSTLLALVAGLDEPESGRILLNGRRHRLGRVGYMPQTDALQPWRDALGNAAVPLELHGMARREARRRAAELFRQFGLDGFEEARPHELSGGMRQRVALARTVLASGDLLVLDEPFGALDALTRARMQDWLLATWPELGRAGLLVTHDVEEALLLADDVYVLSERPARVLERLPSPFPRPRGRSLLSHPQFGAQKLRLLRLLGA